MRNYEVSRETISAKYLLAAPPRDEDAMIPEGFVVTQCRARTAAGAHKARYTGSSGAATTGAVRALADRRELLRLGFYGWGGAKGARQPY